MSLRGGGGSHHGHHGGHGMYPPWYTQVGYPVAYQFYYGANQCPDTYCPVHDDKCVCSCSYRRPLAEGKGGGSLGSLATRVVSAITGRGATSGVARTLGWALFGAPPWRPARGDATRGFGVFRSLDLAEAAYGALPLRREYAGWRFWIIDPRGGRHSARKPALRSSVYASHSADRQTTTSLSGCTCRREGLSGHHHTAYGFKSPWGVPLPADVWWAARCPDTVCVKHNNMCSCECPFRTLKVKPASSVWDIDLKGWTDPGPLGKTLAVIAVVAVAAAIVIPRIAND